ncbi:MAG: diacylglyceryl transferase, partial [Rubripirellula sp.]
MQRTLLLIPHEIAGIPVFGIGWLLIAILLAILLRLAIGKYMGAPVGKILATETHYGLIGFAISIFLLPRAELKNVDGDPVGMAVRGYGVLLLLAVASALGLAAYRARRRGFDPDVIFSVAPFVFA